MIESIIEFIVHALGESSDAIARKFEGRTPLPGEFFKARKALTLHAYVRGHASDLFLVSVANATTVRVADEHLSPAGEILVTVHHDGHFASLPRKHIPEARAAGYLLRIPPRLLRTSFRSITATPS